MNNNKNPSKNYSQTDKDEIYNIKIRQRKHTLDTWENMRIKTDLSEIVRTRRQ